MIKDKHEKSPIDGNFDVWKEAERDFLTINLKKNHSKIHFIVVKINIFIALLRI